MEIPEKFQSALPCHDIMSKCRKKKVRKYFYMEGKH